MAGYIAEEDIARVREATDIADIIGSYAPLRQKGRDLWCCCPLHQEKTPSLKIDVAKQLWHCFGCNQGGDVFGFLMKLEGLTYPEAVRKLAERAHIELRETEGAGSLSQSTKSRLKAICAETASFYQRQLMRSKAPEAAAARSYLAGRGMGSEVSRRWMLGFAPGRSQLIDHLGSLGFSAEEMMTANVALRAQDGRLRDRFFDRIIFPINDVAGDCIAFGGRVIGKGEPKYLNSQETPLFHKSRVLYGLDKAKASLTSTGTAIVVEGYTDVIALSEAGIHNVVATLGTALTSQHVKILSRHAQKRIVYLFDGDAAGQRAALRALSFIDESLTPEAGRTRVELLAVTLPDDLDPAEFVAAKGAEGLQRLIDGATPLLQHGINQRLAGADLTTPEKRSKAFAETIALLAPIKETLLAKDYAIQIAARCGVRETAALEALEKLKAPASYPSASREGAPSGGRPGADGSVPSDASSQGGARNVGERRPLSVEQRNRKRFERALLGMFAQYPPEALARIQVLAQTHWHGQDHVGIAASMVETLAANGLATPAEVISKAEEAVPGASSLLTELSVGDGSQSDDMIAGYCDYLVEEIRLGDLEEQIGETRRLLASDATMAPDEREALFAKVVEWQRDLARRQTVHARSSFTPEFVHEE